MAFLSAPQQAALLQALRPRLTPAIPHVPTIRQTAFLLLNHLPEVFFGGAAGGGKSDALLMAALQYADVPDYSALIVRRTFADLAQPGAIMDRAQAWQRQTGYGRWYRQAKLWSFPKGGRLVFGYLQHDKDKYQYQSAEFQFIGFDELTQFAEPTYLYMFSRLRRLVSQPLPLRMRSASNPGNIGHEWVKARFVRPEQTVPQRAFVPSRLADNPHVDQRAYEQSLSNLDAATKAQLLEGNWDVLPAGDFFRRAWFPVVADWPRQAALVRYWDLAAARRLRPLADHDWLVGTLLAEMNGQYWVVDVRRQQGTALDQIRLIQQTAELDGPTVPIYIEQEGGASPLIALDFLQRVTLRGYPVYTDIKRVPKVERAKPLSAAAEAGNVFVVRGAWNMPWLEEFEMYPQMGFHDDQVDSASGAFHQLAFAERFQMQAQQRPATVRLGY